MNDTDRLGSDHAMRWIAGGKTIERGGVPTSQMAGLEIKLLSTNKNLVALANLQGAWIDKVHRGQVLQALVMWPWSAL